MNKIFPNKQLFFTAAFSLSCLLILFRSYLGMMTTSGSTDIQGFYLPIHLFLQNAISRGIFPALWTDQIGLGFLIGGDPEAGVFYPGNFLTAFLPGILSFNIGILIHVFFFWFGTYRIFRFWGSSQEDCFLKATILTCGGFMFCHIPHPGLLKSFAYVPWVYLEVFRFFQGHKISWRQSLGIVSLVAFSLLAGHPQGAFFTILSGLVAFIEVRRRIHFKRAAHFSLLVFLGLSLWIPQGLLTFFLSQGSGRIAQTLTQWWNLSLHPGHLLMQFSPWVFGFGYSSYSFFHSFPWKIMANPGELFFYLSPVTLLFFLSRMKSERYLAGVAFVFLMLAFGKNVPFLNAHVFSLPVFENLRNPMRWFGFCAFWIGLVAFRFPDSHNWELRGKSSFVKALPWVMLGLGVFGLTIVENFPGYSLFQMRYQLIPIMLGFGVLWLCRTKILYGALVTIVVASFPFFSVRDGMGAFWDTEIKSNPHRFRVLDLGLPARNESMNHSVPRLGGASSLLSRYLASEFSLQEVGEILNPKTTDTYRKWGIRWVKDKQGKIAEDPMARPPYRACQQGGECAAGLTSEVAGVAINRLGFEILALEKPSRLEFSLIPGLCYVLKKKGVPSVSLNWDEDALSHVSSYRVWEPGLWNLSPDYLRMLRGDFCLARSM